MYQGYTETPQQIEARMARRNAQHAAAVAARETISPSATVCPPMTETEWWGLPAVVRYFHPIERATQPLEIVR
jgi:hypothetical protein